MRNLRNIRHTRLVLGENHLPLAASTWDADTDSLICAFGPTESEAVIELRRFGKDTYRPEDSKLIASWNAPCPLPDLACDRVLCIRYFPETTSTCLILAGGDLVVVQESPGPDQDLIEIVGSIDAGITGARWSPDEELVAITTRADTFLLMTRSFESTANTQISPEDVKISAHVSVGWGKRETQFQGKRAKALRDPTIPEHVDEGLLSLHDDGSTTISWRGDGAFVAVNLLEQSQRRMIRVYNREGALDSVSEPVNGLEAALSWRPAGNLIAAVASREDGVEVVFFERNGLRHGEFSLRLSEKGRPDWADKIQLDWNIDSTVLAVSFRDRVQFWTMGNYHYYLKQEVRYPKGCLSLLSSTTWHPERSLVLASQGSKHIDRLQFALDACVGSVLPPDDIGLALVLDGTTLKVTPHDLANIPPPMAFVDMLLPDVAIDACSTASANRISVLLHDTIVVYHTDFQGDSPSAYRLESTVNLRAGLISDHEIPRQIATNASQDLLILVSSTDGCAERILRVDEKGDLVDAITEVSPVATITSSLDFHDIIYQSTDPEWTASRLNVLGKGQDVAKLQISLPVVCSRTAFWSSKEADLAFGLSSGGSLLVYGRETDADTATQLLNIKSVTSFVVTAAHLIFTTTQHVVKFVHLRAGKLEIPSDEPEIDERCRSIERGARLVTAMPTSYSIVLQMPRGNLETIYPRALVLAGIRRSIIAKDYRTAFFACRNHRVDLNILYDYMPEQFLQNIGHFVDQLKKQVHIDLFLSQLRDEDVSRTLYKETLDDRAHVSTGADMTESSQGSSGIVAHKVERGSKVNRICEAFLVVLEQRRATNLQNIVTAHVCKVPPDLEAGLTLVSELRRRESGRVDEALEHICFLSDVNRLYDAALGLYDLDIAILVAQQSQKDPREYLPYMQSLESLEPLRRNFQIDDDLKRYEKALTHLYALDNFEELKTYVTKHKLYAVAIELHKYNALRLADVTRLFAEYLSSTDQHKEAAIAFEGLQDHDRASDSYVSAQMWREALSCAHIAGRPAEAIREVAQALADAVTESKDHSSAAQIYADHLDDIPSAARSWCRAYRFDEAVRIVSLKDRKELVLSVIDPGLADGLGSLTELLAEMKSQLHAQVPRLRELRVKKSQDPLSFYAGTALEGKDIPDDVSLAASQTSTHAASFMTRYTSVSAGNSTLATDATRRTGKNRRREERKRARGKKGSVYEEEYLVASLGRLVERLNVTGPDVEGTVVGLARRGMRERAVALQSLAVEVEKMASACLNEVFGQQRQQQQQQQQGQQSSGGVGEEYTAGVPSVPVPVVKPIATLSLLG